MTLTLTLTVLHTIRWVFPFTVGLAHHVDHAPMHGQDYPLHSRQGLVLHSTSVTCHMLHVTVRGTVDKASETQV